MNEPRRSGGSARAVFVVATVAGLLAALHPAGCGKSGECSSNADCDDGVFCNGVETCGSNGRCYHSAVLACQDALDCNIDSCDEATHACTHTALDRDGDTFADAACGGDDCNDDNAAVHPGATEVCDGLDDDCNGTVDEDHDGDRHYSPSFCPGVGDDCDDENADVYPGAPEICDGIDDNCNGTTDDERDTDGDTYVDTTCTGGNDCDDEDPLVHPGADETCNDVDDDCDTLTDETFACRRGVAVPCWTTCGSQGTGHCTDHCALPTGAGCVPPAEVCGNGRDDDCDGQTDEGCPTSDAGTCAPGAVECCADGVDNDCDGVTDEAACTPTGGCTPGQVRSCPTSTGVGWGAQLCPASGAAWGPCTEDAPPPGCPRLPAPGWDPACCADSGVCCQDTADADGDGSTTDSIGLAGACAPEPACS